MRMGADFRALTEFDDVTLVETPRIDTSYEVSTVPAVLSPHQPSVHEETGSVHEHMRKKCVELLAQLTDSPRRVLELGGGLGYLAEQICRAMDVAEYVLLDPSPHMLDLADHRLQDFESIRSLVVSCANPLRSQRVKGPFDAVLAVQTMHELRPKRQHLALFQRIRSLLLPGGTFLVADLAPLRDCPSSRQLYATLEETCEWLHAVGFLNVTLELTDSYARVGGKSSALHLISATRG